MILDPIEFGALSYVQIYNFCLHKDYNLLYGICNKNYGITVYKKYDKHVTFYNFTLNTIYPHISFSPSVVLIAERGKKFLMNDFNNLKSDIICGFFKDIEKMSKYVTSQKIVGG